MRITLFLAAAVLFVSACDDPPPTCGEMLTALCERWARCLPDEQIEIEQCIQENLEFSGWDLEDGCTRPGCQEPRECHNYGAFWSADRAGQGGSPVCLESLQTESCDSDSFPGCH